MLALPTILNFHAKVSCSWKINFPEWVGGAAGDMKNKAKLSLNWVLARAVAKLGKRREKLWSSNHWLVNLPLSFMYLKPKQVIRAWSKEKIEFDTEDQVLSSVCLFYDDLVIVSGWAWQHFYLLLYLFLGVCKTLNWLHVGDLFRRFLPLIELYRRKIMDKKTL